MEYINIQTAQNVTIQYETASISDRIAAYLLDWIVLIGYVIVVLIILNYLTLLTNLNIYGLIFMIPALLFDLLFEYYTDGQSVGKKLLSIKVVMLDGSQPGIGAYLLRWLLRLADITLSSGVLAIIVIAAGGKGQRLGDIAAGTCVVKLRNQSKLDNFTPIETQVNYTPLYLQAIRLSDADAAIISDALNMAIQQNNTALLETLAEKVSALLEVEKQHNSKEFIENVLKDYRYLTTINI